MAAFTVGDDGFFHCPEAGCKAAYKLPQHLGLHLSHTHGREGQSKAAKARQVAKARSISKALPPALPMKRASSILPVPVKRASPMGSSTNGRAPLEAKADDICLALLGELAPSGYVRLGAIGPYVEWVKATETFLEKVRALS